MWVAGPSRTRRRRLKLCAQTVLGALAVTAAGHPAIAADPPVAASAGNSAPAPGQVIRIPLEPLGFQPVLEDFLLAGVGGLTVNFVDNAHLLVTYNTKHLMKRDPDEQPSDDDRTVDALLLELPAGKVLARAEWRLHDRYEYLWDLGHGRFLLRVRDRLTLLAPLERLAAGDPFAGQPVLDIGDRHIAALLLSSDKDLLILETVRNLRGPAGSATDVTFAGQGESAPVQINFFRLIDTPEGLAIEPAGVVRAPAPLNVPMTTAGILDIVDGGRNRWLFNFNEHAGKVDELAEWDTTCAPRPTFVGHSEFVAFGCRGSEDKPEIAGFNIKGEQMWEQGLYDTYVSPHLASAPAAGRFVLERTLVTTSLIEDVSIPASAVEGEEVRVYQTSSGKVLLKVNTAPVERAGGNFALSPDGMLLAVFEQRVRQRTTQLGDPYTESATSLVVYPLPPLTEPDRASLKEMQAKAPVDTGARIDASLARLSRENERRAVASSPGPTPILPQVAAAAASALGASPARAAAVPQTAPPSNAGEAKEPGNPAMNGELESAAADAQNAAPLSDDSQQGARRGPPTLYAPGEAPSAATSKDQKKDQ